MTLSPLYPLIMMLAIAAGAIISRFTQSELQIDKRDKFLIGLAAFCGSMIGAKLPFAVLDVASMLSGGPWFSNGKTIMFGLVGGYAGVEFAKWCLDVKVKTGDSFAIPIAVAIGIGRWACFVGGCCYGTPTDKPWGIVFPHIDRLARHPTQIYESVFHLTMAGILFILYRTGSLRGQLVKFYILSYFGYRFLTEFIRPEVKVLSGLTAYQWAALAFAPIFVWLWVRDISAIESHSTALTND